MVIVLFRPPFQLLSYPFSSHQWYSIRIYVANMTSTRISNRSEPNSRDAPILLRFYFEFVLRNKIFVEKDVNRAYEKALQVVKRAEIELPYTFRISRAFPEAWGRACSTLWGKRDRDPWAVFTNSQLDRAAEAVNDAALSVSDDSSDGLNQHELVEAKYDLGERMIKEDAVSVKSPPVYLEKIGVAEDGGGATIEELDEAEVLDENMPTADKLVQPEYASLANGINGGHSTQEDYGANDSQAVDGIQNQDELNRTNGTSADANGAVEPNANDVVGGEEYAGWGSDDVERQKPGWGGADDGFDEEVWGNYVTPSIFPFVGPSLLPCTHIPIRVEESTRILVDIIAADPNSPNLLTSTLGVLVLQPWPSPNDDIDSMVKTPQLITFKENEKTYSASLAARNASRKFDPSKDQIRVYVDPVVLTECRVGMGIGGLWVQVGRKVEESEEDKEKDDEGAGKKTYTKKKKSSKAASDEWWYMESFRHAIPGYWTANEAERDMTRIENNPEYLYEYSE